MRIIYWIILSLCLQLLVLFYFDTFYLNNNSEIISSNYTQLDDLPKTGLNYGLPDGATNIKVSNDAKYIAYLNGWDLVVANLKNRTEVNTITSYNGIISYYKWIPDRNILVYSQGMPSKSSGFIEIKTYDAENYTEKKFPKIKVESFDETEIQDIEFSVLTNVVYVKIKVNNYKSKIYRFDIMNTSKYIMQLGSNSVIKETYLTDKMIYQDENYKVYVRDGSNGTTKQIAFEKKVVLLGVDSEDKVYVGELESYGMINKIFYSKNIDKSPKNWYYIPLDKSCPVNDIIISPDGEVYQKSENGNTLFDLVTNKTIAYSDTFVELLSKYIITMRNNNLNIKKFSNS